jgi:hypothetical protein
MNIPQMVVVLLMIYRLVRVKRDPILIRARSR